MQTIKLLGAGGFGKVELVEDQNGHLFARKAFSNVQNLDGDLLNNVIQRFKKEARIQKSISHQNIVPIIDHSLESDPPYYFMPVAESSLAKDIADNRTLGGNFIAAIADIVAALEEMHSVHIYHRDLKPQNVLRFSSENDPEPVTYYAVSDFGLISLQESQLSSLTTTGMAKGSDHYTAPEITRDLRRASPQSDVYSLGCILHDMVGVADRVPCAEIREEGPYAGILSGCTRISPERRFRSVRAVLDAIVSVGIENIETESRQAADFVGDLASENTISFEEWMALADFLDSKAGDQDKAAICANLNAQRITDLCTTNEAAANLIGRLYADWVFNTLFPFNHCDGISSRLEIFVVHCHFDVKIECLIAMLRMGTSHNRWYVERKFMRLCSPQMDEALAKRLAIEFRVRDSWVCGPVSHLERSIDVSRDQLHPELVAALNEICK